MSKPVLGYWDIRGYAMPIRFLLAHLDVDYEDKLYVGPTPENPSIEVWLKDKFDLDLEFPNLPYWIQGDIKLTESRAILRHVAREYGQNLISNTPELIRREDMVENVLADIWNDVIMLRYAGQGEETFSQSQPKKFEQVVKFIGSNKWIFGDQITYLDFFLYDVLYFYNVHDAEILKPFPTLLAFQKNFESLPKIAKYIASPNYIKGPCIIAVGRDPF